MEKFAVTQPVEVITLAEAKEFARVDYSGDDALLTSLISSARAYCETHTGAYIGEQTWDLSFDGFPKAERRFNPRAELVIPAHPLISITSVKYLDAAGVEQTLASNLYRVTRGFNSKIAILDTWPDTFDGSQTVTVRAKLGWKKGANVSIGETEIPADLHQALKILICHWYEYRAEIYTGGMQLFEMPKHMSVERICKAYSRVNL